MTAPVSRPIAHSGRFDRLWWLPGGGHGNGLDDESWAPVLEVSRRIMPRRCSAYSGRPCVSRLAQAPAGSAHTRRREVKGRPESYQLWVGASAYGEAEEGTANGDAVPRA